MAKEPAKKVDAGAAAKRPGPKLAVNQIDISEHFKLVFVSVVLFTIISFGTAVTLGVTDDGERSIKYFLLATAGVGAIVGLIVLQLEIDPGGETADRPGDAERTGRR